MVLTLKLKILPEIVMHLQICHAGVTFVRMQRQT